MLASQHRAPTFALPGTRRAGPAVWETLRWERPAVGLGILAAAALHLYFLHIWLDFVDEGYFLDLADRMLRGDMPYRDFFTPYTPGVLYLHLWAMELLGREVTSLRWPLVAANLALGLITYVLGRRVASPPFAALPVVMLYATGTIPVMWEPHPAWYALLFAMVTVWSVCRLRESGKHRWLVVAGVSAALGFACKQNFGLLMLAAVAGYLLLLPDELPLSGTRLPLPRVLRGNAVFRLAQSVYAVGLLSGLFWLLKQFLQADVVVVFWLPVAVWLAIVLPHSWRLPPTPGIVGVTIERLLLVSLAFVLTTVPWVLLLARALQPFPVPLAQFLGDVDVASFYWPLAQPRLGFFLFLTAAVAAPFAIHRLVSNQPLSLRLTESVSCLIIALAACDLALADPVLADPDFSVEAMTLYHLSVRAAQVVQLYLPVLAFWGGLTLALREARARRLLWYLLAGSLMLFNLYPRMDSLHVTMSAPLLWVVGAAVLNAAARRLLGLRLSSSARIVATVPLFAALLVLPAGAALPSLEWRGRSLISTIDGVPKYEVPDFVPMGLPGADVLVPWNTRNAVQRVVHFIQASTSPGEKIFVYPTLPAFYFLTERANATRFGHAYPGAATPAELQEMNAQLDASVRYIIWDSFWVREWGNSDLNKPLTDHIRAQYQDWVYLEPFWVLKRID
ncbi:MAG: glycosyltransferase family 39 protein [Chloroflexi bacterium]|nr:glycosyltransferase family 39 protein [Chloroflexota bacterium]